jgi:hypothetical protein
MAKAPKQDKAADNAGAKAAPAKSAKKPAAPQAAPVNHTTDKFGLALLILVLVLAIGCLVVWGKAGVARAGIDMFGMFQDTGAEYDLKSSQAKLLSYSATGMIGGDPTVTDTVLINQGRINGVHVGDVFVPSGGSKAENIFAEFCVTSVQDSTCIAIVKTNLDLASGAAAKDGEVVPAGDNKNDVVMARVSSVYPAESTTLERKWAAQTTRKLAVARQ